MARLREDDEFGYSGGDDALSPFEKANGGQQYDGSNFIKSDAAELYQSSGLDLPKGTVIQAPPQAGSTESPRELFDKPERTPPTRRAPQASMPSAEGESGNPAESMTPARPKTPSPSVAEPPQAPVQFSPMDPLASPESMLQPMNESYSAAQVQQRAPALPEPSYQYQDTNRSSGMFGRAGGLTGGGLGLPDEAGISQDPQLDALLRALMGEL